MEAVFLGGSRRVARLNERIRAKLDDLLGRGLLMFVGDANGADRALQEYLAKRRYDRVVVYSITGMLRNNVGHWEVRSVDPPKGARGFDLYSAKDKQMANDASYGFMLWDGKSRGTLENVRNLLVRGKPVAVHFGPAHRFVSLKSPEDLSKLGIIEESVRYQQRDFSFGPPPHAAEHAVVFDSPKPSRPDRVQPKRRRSVSVRGRS